MNANSTQAFLILSAARKTTRGITTAKVVARADGQFLVAVKTTSTGTTRLVAVKQTRSGLKTTSYGQGYPETVAADATEEEAARRLPSKLPTRWRNALSKARQAKATPKPVEAKELTLVMTEVDLAALLKTHLSRVEDEDLRASLVERMTRDLVNRAEVS